MHRIVLFVVQVGHLQFSRKFPPDGHQFSLCPFTGQLYASGRATYNVVVKRSELGNSNKERTAIGNFEWMASC